MINSFSNNRQWNSATWSVIAPGLGQWANGQYRMAAVFLCIHSCATVWLWIPLMVSETMSKNQWLLGFGALALWALSVFEAHIRSNNASPLALRHIWLEIPFVALLSVIAALNVRIPDPVINGQGIQPLIYSIPMAASVILDPITGSFIGITASVLQFFLKWQPLPITIVRCMTIPTACGLASLAGMRIPAIAGISLILPSIAEILILDVQIKKAMAFTERLAIFWVSAWLISLLFAEFRRQFNKISQYESPISQRLHNPLNKLPSQTESLYNPQRQIQQQPVKLTSNQRQRSNDIWGRLVDENNLVMAWEKVQANNGAPGVDGVKISDFATNAHENISTLRTIIENGQYQSSILKKFSIPKSSGSLRYLSIPTVRDRIVQQALMQVLVPVFDPLFLECSFAYRPRRSAHHALKRVDQHLKEGYGWILDGDIQSFFDTVSHDVLLCLIQKRITDMRILSLIKETLSVTEQSGIGIPQGAATSTLYSNIYLHVFDKSMMDSEQLLTRYADDFVAVCKTPEATQDALNTASQTLTNPLRLNLNKEKTRICSIEDGFVFLGYQFDKSGRRPSERAIGSLTTKVRDKMDESKQLGESSASAMERLRSSVRGWCNYFEVDIDHILGNNDGVLPSKEISEPIFNNQSISEQFSHEHLNKFMELFQGKQGVYAHQWVNQTGKNGYVPMKQPLTPDAVNAHLAGQETIALYLMRQDNTVYFSVIDIDTKDSGAGGIEETHKVALRIKELGSRNGLSIYIEDSGRKGRHCWMFFSDPVTASKSRQLGKLLVAKSSPIEKGIACEIFPKQERIHGNALGSLIKLPLGIHQQTQRRCLFLKDDGNPFSDQENYLFQIRRMSPQSVEASINSLSGRESNKSDINPNGDNCVQKALQGCSVLRFLVGRAQELKHLNHSERLVLLYTLGKLGEEGKEYIHQVMGYCDNYNSKITQKWINRLDPEHNPISCARIKDWLFDIIPAVGCSCTGNLYGGKYPSPVFYAQESMEISHQPNLQSSEDQYPDTIPEDPSEIQEMPCLDDIWRELEDDIFSVEEDTIDGG
ncbi:group II intron reverse transcriptase/maturase [Candidatus Poribacteria bacterium]|nr:group II intron reverse transcriptase/maturase [Candidatus Poribacteria bacterium]